MAKKIYEELGIQMLAFAEEDVITASGGDFNSTEEGAQEDPFCFN